MEDDTRRRHNIEVLTAMLDACGRKDFDTGFEWFTEDLYCDWPYIPIENMDKVMVGRDAVKAFFEEGQKDFAGLDYTINRIYELVDPDTLIVEYSSDSMHLDTGVPYRNDYLGILKFRDCRICYWREYINPLAIQAVFRQIADH